VAICFHRDEYREFSPWRRAPKPQLDVLERADVRRIFLFLSICLPFVMIGAISCFRARNVSMVSCGSQRVQRLLGTAFSHGVNTRKSRDLYSVARSRRWIRNWSNGSWNWARSAFGELLIFTGGSLRLNLGLLTLILSLRYKN
jgi:hypothetical protein